MGTKTGRSFMSWLAFAVLLVAGLAVRFYDLTDLPLDFHPTRQLFSALKARGLYALYNPHMPEWQREIALRQWQGTGIIEPPVMEFIVAQTYRLTGIELWVARVYSILFWMSGAIPVFLLARRLGKSQIAGLVATGIYVSLPYGGIASRSFQPDPLMVALIVWSWWSIYSWYEKPSMKYAVVAGLISGLAIFVKNLAIFLLLPPIILLIFERYRWRFWREKFTWVILVLTALPAAVYTAYGLWIAGFLGSQFGGRFFPSLWVDKSFYNRWL